MRHVYTWKINTVEPLDKRYIESNINSAVLSFIERLSYFRGSQCYRERTFGTSSRVLCREVYYTVFLAISEGRPTVGGSTVGGSTVIHTMQRCSYCHRKLPRPTSGYAYIVLLQLLAGAKSILAQWTIIIIITYNTETQQLAIAILAPC